jgi:pyrroline-5-carboxylate reductase
MGVAIVSGVLASLESISRSFPKWESHTPGTVTPVGPPDATTPTRFLACVKREETAHCLVQTFKGPYADGRTVEITTGANVQAVQQADVVLLW